MKILTTILLLLLTISSVQADDAKPSKNLKEYDVEIIIFEDAHARYLSSETWQQSAEITEQEADRNKEPENLDKPSLNEMNRAHFKAIKPGILSRQYKRINTSSEYNVLFYSAWRQTGLKASDAFEININELKSIHTDKSKNALTGTFKLVLARYLHIYNQLDYQRKTVLTETEQQTEIISNETRQGKTIYPLNSHRRMRSKELHYIDHPLVGILIQINPVKKKKAL